MMIIDPVVNAYPYLILLAICVLVVLVVFWKYPPMRAYRRKRNLMAYAALIAIFCLISYRAYDVTAGPNLVSFGIQKTQSPIFVGQQNQFTVTCYSQGAKNVQFYVVFKSANATLQTGGQQGYIQVNDTAIKIPFSFHGEGQETKPVYFTAANATSLSFYPSVERQTDSPMIVTAYLTNIQCNWDEATQSFAMADSPPLAVPMPAIGGSF
ncbi:MAG: hypothetical protein NWE93_07115 [Candidatus Bathyarchaeota archaeon]|nr:hypothetical protein [Candidatus Bathyarchaeota archaeon]